MGKWKKCWAICLALALTLCVPSMAQEADRPASVMNAECKFRVSEGKSAPLTDEDLETVWAPSKKGARFLVELPDEGAGYLALRWQNSPGAHTVTQYDAEKKEVAKIEYAAGACYLDQAYELHPGARYVLVTLTDSGEKVAGAEVYTKGTLPEEFTRWLGQYGKSDLMVVAPRQGDEYALFGGLLPYYQIVLDKNVQLVYMTDGGRTKRMAALDGLWAIGEKNYPMFLDFPDKQADSTKACLSQWGGKDALLEPLVASIRRSRPEVIVSCSIQEGSGDATDILTATAMQYAIDAAADKTQYPDSAEAYGAWQVKKLYLLGGDTCPLTLDWTAPAEALGGATPLETANLGYSALAANAALDASSATFSLMFSRVGDDVRHDDFFENLTAAPTMEAVLVFSPAPEDSQAPRVETGDATAFGGTTLLVVKVVALGLGALVLLTCLQALIYRFRRRRR